MSDGNKAWSGLVRGYYDRRYQLYADAKLQALTSRGSAQLTEDEEVRWPFRRTESVESRFDRQSRVSTLV